MYTNKCVQILITIMHVKIKLKFIKLDYESTEL